MEILLKNRVPFFSIPFFLGCIMTNKAGAVMFFMTAPACFIPALYFSRPGGNVIC